MPESIASRSDRQAFFDPCAEIPVVELLLPVDAMVEGLVGCEARLFKQGRTVCREREAQRFFGIWEGDWRERALKSGKALKY